MRFFDRKTQQQAASSAYDQKVVLFPGNHFQALPKAVNDLQTELELRDAQQFKNSIAALTQGRNTPKTTVGLFAMPKPKPRTPHLELVTQKISNPRTI